MAFKIVAASVLVVVLCAHVGAVSAKPAETSEPVSTEVPAMKNGTEVVAPAPTPAPLPSAVSEKFEEIVQMLVPRIVAVAKLRLQMLHQQVMQMWMLAAEKISAVLKCLLKLEISPQEIYNLLPAPAAPSMTPTRTIA